MDARVESFDPGNGITIERVRNVIVERNIIAHLSGLSTYSIGMGLNRFDNLNVNNNIIYNWANNQTSGPAYGCGIQVGANRLGVNNIDSNAIQFLLPQNNCINVSTNFNLLSLTANKYFNTLNPNVWFSEGSFSAWTSASGEINGMVEQVDYLDPNRTITSYLTHIGSPGTLSDFYQLRSEMNKSNWSQNYEANTINNYIREGFNMETDLQISPIKAIVPIEIFPNPTNSKVTIKAQKGMKYLLSNTFGQVMFSGEFTSEQEEINLENLNSGIYFLSIDQQSIKISKF